MSDRMKNNQRRIRYLDRNIQKWLLIGLVTMEVALVSIAMWVLYKTSVNIIDEAIYHVHFAGHSSIFGHLLNEGIKMLGVVFLVNLIALVLADRIWAYQVNHIIRNLMSLMNDSLKLDFSEKDSVQCNHTVLVHATSWRQTESARIEKLRHDIQALPASLPKTEKEREEIAALLEKITSRLPTS